MFREFKITKEQISLKELDFKLKSNLLKIIICTANVGSGKIVINTWKAVESTRLNYTKNYKKIMADVIDGTNIDNIEVNIK